MSRWRVLVVIASATAVCVAICLSTHNQVADTIGAVPLVIWLPGAAIVAAADPLSRRVAGTERIYWSLIASMGASVLGGLVLNLAGGLDRTSWSVVTSIVVAVAVVTGLLRRPSTAPEAPADDWAPEAPAEDGVEATPARQSMSRPLRSARRVSLRSVVLLCVAVLLTGGSIVLSEVSSARDLGEQFVELWMLPSPADASNFATRLEVGIDDYETGTTTFLVRVKGDGPKERTWLVQLARRQDWTTTISRARDEEVVATVSLASSPGRILSSVHIDPALR
jgi:uncharacterized membrane protein